MKTDISIHFTLKGQTIDEINKKINDYINDNLDNLPFDFSEKTNPRKVLHHCFLPERIVEEKGFSKDIYTEILHPMSENKVCWYGTSDYGLEWDRRLMLENLVKLNGLAVFVGDIKEDIKDEFKICQELYIDCVLIP